MKFVFQRNMFGEFILVLIGNTKRLIHTRLKSVLLICYRKFFLAEQTIFRNKDVKLRRKSCMLIKK
jgi:hypothetical protein